MNPPIVILTDFGLADPFVGIMKGVIAQIAPQTPLIDLTHEIPPGDIRRAAVTLWQSVDYFPASSIFLVVVDPGVGTSRRAVILDNRRQTFIAPDNGVLAFVRGENFRACEISNPRLALPHPGTTFHGRDLFAPAAAHASLGVPHPEFGEALTTLEVLPLPQLTSPAPGRLCGQTLHADRFGNLLTSLGKFSRSAEEIRFTPWIGQAAPFALRPEAAQLALADGRTLAWTDTFAEISPGKCAVILGSSGLLEIAANRQSAANLLNLRADEPVTLRFEPTRK